MHDGMGTPAQRNSVPCANGAAPGRRPSRAAIQPPCFARTRALPKAAARRHGQHGFARRRDDAQRIAARLPMPAQADKINGAVAHDFDRLRFGGATVKHGRDGMEEVPDQPPVDWPWSEPPPPMPIENETISPEAANIEIVDETTNRAASARAPGAVSWIDALANSAIVAPRTWNVRPINRSSHGLSFAGCGVRGLRSGPRSRCSGTGARCRDNMKSAIRGTIPSETANR